MGQKFKAVYFSDCQEFSQATSLTLAFSDKDESLYEKVKALSSQEIRELLSVGTFTELEKKAHKADLPLNIYSLRVLKKKLLKTDQTEKIHPKYVTFRSSKTEPFQSWYPYLEGYSPNFVNYIIDNFSPNARNVYDPFAGTGTTPLTATSRGLKSLYSEINPLMQYLTEAKILARSISSKEKPFLIDLLKEIRENLIKNISQAEPDQQLKDSYYKVFGKSVFFDEDTFDLVLKSRSYTDGVGKKHQLASKLLTVAIFSSLVPASLLQRSGDLRYKTKKELLTKKVDFLKQIKLTLENIINDLYNLNISTEKPVLIVENAKGIGSLPHQEIDTVITSPPYLNGTNYFRNTKIELWFIRSLQSQQDLSDYRSNAVTAGINDVSFKKETIFVTDSIKILYDTLLQHSYDKRIPKMVVDYFKDSNTIFSELRRHLTPGATIAIDIGDSIYSGIHVKTDELLTDVLLKLGYVFKQEVILRKRISRQGEILKQVLLVFTYKELTKLPKTNKSSCFWENDWNNFKNNLPHQKEPYSKRNWGHPLHSLCSYQGKMKPSLAHYLVKTFVPENGSMLDIFSGVGTIPFEAALNGRKSYGFEISPAALAISQAKLKKPDLNKVFKIISELNDYIKNNEPEVDEIARYGNFGYNGTLNKYFSQETLKEILLARKFFSDRNQEDGSISLVFSCLLHILHGNRPYALSRRSHPIIPLSPQGEYEYKALIPRLQDKVTRSLNSELPDTFVEGNIFFQDSTLWWPRELNNLDAIITSPPFFDSTRFYSANWMRLWFSGWNDEDFKEKPLDFIDEKQKRDFSIYEPIFRQSRERLKPGGTLVLHLGKSKKCDMAEILSSIAKKYFRFQDVYSEGVEHCESHGMKDKGTVVDHQYLVLT